jgi:hypothetical protein
MDITYTLNILKIYTKSTDTLADIVSLVEWELTGVFEDKKVSLKGSTNLPIPDTENFVDFNRLSEEQVAAWVISNDTNATLFKENIKTIMLDPVLYSNQLQLKWLPWEADPFLYFSDTGDK